MITLILESIQIIISQTFHHFLAGNIGNLAVDLPNGSIVMVNIAVREGRFDCGTPGFNMANADVVSLRPWTGINIRSHIEGVLLVGGLAPCKMVGDTGQVNVVLRDATGKLIFNFHVNLTAPC